MPHLSGDFAGANRFAVPVFTIPFAAIINSKLAKQNATAQDPWANEWLKRNAAGGGAYKLEGFPQRSGRALAQ